MNRPVRVRFAPSPTGPLHIGGVRTALYNYLFAKKNKGAFILRIEDTDQNRYVEGSEAYIQQALSWCGLHFDESPGLGGAYGPYRQSERKDIYSKYAEDLVSTGHAYYAFDSQESLEILRSGLEAQGKTFIYNWENREKLANSLSVTPAETKAILEGGAEYVVRFKSPENETLVLNDRIRGQIEIDTRILDDKVLFKSDGMPTYHLANVVDDHLMEITHVIRGEEWLPSLALHVLLYRAFGWEAPDFAHLPLIMKPEGKGKLSKRDGEKMGFPVFPLSWENSKGYRESGYFPQAVINFLALLGWNPGTEQEIFSMEELIEAFSLDRVHKSGARFDPEKTKWYNHKYLQAKTDAELADLLQTFAVKGPLSGTQAPELSHTIHDTAYVERVVHMIKERAYFIEDLWESGSYFFVTPTTYNPKALKKHWKETSHSLLGSLLEHIRLLDDFHSQALEASIKDWIDGEKISFGQIMPILRLVVVGDLKGPHLFDIMALLGKVECIRRISHALNTLA